MKKLFGILAISVLAVSLTGISATAKTFVMGIAHLGQVGSVTDLGAKKWGELLEKKSKGKVKAKFYPAEQMGKEADIVTSMQMGSVEASLMGTTLYKQAAPEYNIWSAYYLFSDSKEAMALQNTKVGGKVPPGGSEEQGHPHCGLRHARPPLYNLQPAIKQPKDCEGLKIRVPLQPIYVASWKKLGAIPTPIPFGEVYTSLKMGVVEAQENPLQLIDSAHFDEVQKFVNLTAHQYSFYTYAVSEAWLSGLPKDLQKIVIETGKEAGEYHTKLQNKMEADLKAKLQKKGMKFINSDRAAFAAALKDIPKQFESKWVPGLYEEILKEKAKLK